MEKSETQQSLWPAVTPAT